MTTATPTTSFTEPAPAEQLERAAAALRAHGLSVEILDDLAIARARVKELIPDGSTVFTGASETLRLSEIEEDINTSGSQLPAYAGGAGRRILVVGAQKVVPDLSAALRRVEDHCLPLENERARAVYGSPSTINSLFVLNAEPHPGRTTVLIVREAVGF
jgi:hypothetical protein